MRDARSSTEGRRETLGSLLEGLTARHASTNRACFAYAHYLHENLPAATRTRSGVRASASKDLIASTCADWQEQYDLSTMQTAVLEEAAQGGTRPDIALKMNISPETVKTHTQKLIAKTGDESLASAGARLIREIVEQVSSRKGRGG